MELPEFFYDITFWLKFVPVYLVLVIAPIFFLDVTGSLDSFLYKLLFAVAGAFGVMLALSGRSIGKAHSIGGLRR